MENNFTEFKNIPFHRLKIKKKALLTKKNFLLELEIPEALEREFSFEAGQYLTFKMSREGEIFYRDFSMASAPFEKKLIFGIKLGDENSLSTFIYQNYQENDFVEVSEPRGRFTLMSKPHEFRTIIGFAAGIGITPVLSHFKNILQNEQRTRLFLFYGNSEAQDIAFREEIDAMAQQNSERFQVFYFLSKEKTADPLFSGRLDAQRLKLIINQILHLDDTDEESTIWDAVDEVLICGKGEMIREIANACHANGIPKKNIHFELFQAFNEDIYPQEKEFPPVENILVNFKINDKDFSAILPDNRMKILQQLLVQNFPVPYSCKSGICGSCICQLEKGDVQLIENEYLTEKEKANGKILACMSVPLSKEIQLNFDI